MRAMKNIFPAPGGPPRLALFLLLLIVALSVPPAGVTVADEAHPYHLYLPAMKDSRMEELRALWVTRFDWTRWGQPASPDAIDQIVEDAAAAGFNAIFFQVRASADAYYRPGPEPWAARVSGVRLGEPPDTDWDPLAHFIAGAHERGLQLHAYINVYPVWDNCDTAPPADTTPTHFYYALRDEHGFTRVSDDGGEKLNGLQWNEDINVHCSGYRRATPASIFVDDHLMAVATHLVTNYDLDGLHLDHIRYGGRDTSCDPVSEARWGAPCFNGAYADWQRRQVNGTVARFYDEIVPLRAELMLSAAVWPVYRDIWDWGVNGGYDTYYQDSKGWLAAGTVHAISPMIYPAWYDGCMEKREWWSRKRWETLVADFQGDSLGRMVLPGIGGDTCSFAEIAARIQMARDLGTAGHALFSYGALARRDYFDDLAQGPYARPAVPPPLPTAPAPALGAEDDLSGGAGK